MKKCWFLCIYKTGLKVKKKNQVNGLTGSKFKQIKKSHNPSNSCKNRRFHDFTTILLVLRFCNGFQTTKVSKLQNHRILRFQCDFDNNSLTVNYIDDFH